MSLLTIFSVNLRASFTWNSCKSFATLAWVFESSILMLLSPLALPVFQCLLAYLYGLLSSLQPRQHLILLVYVWPSITLAHLGGGSYPRVLRVCRIGRFFCRDIFRYICIIAFIRVWIWRNIWCSNALPYCLAFISCSWNSMKQLFKLCSMMKCIVT